MANPLQMQVCQVIVTIENQKWEGESRNISNSFNIFLQIYYYFLFRCIFYRKVNEDIPLTRKVFGVCIFVCLRVTRQRSQKLSDSLEIWHKCLYVMRNQLYKFWCTLTQYLVYKNRQKYLNTLRPKQKKVFVFFLVCVCQGAISVAELQKRIRRPRRGILLK